MRLRRASRRVEQAPRLLSSFEARCARSSKFVNVLIGSPREAFALAFSPSALLRMNGYHDVPAGSAALQSRSSFGLPHPTSGSGEPRSQPLDTTKRFTRSQDEVVPLLDA